MSGEDWDDRPLPAVRPGLSASARLPEPLRERWAEALEGINSDPLLRAVYRVALGEPIRAAARAEGYKDHAAVWRAAKKYRLLPTDRDTLVEGHRRIAKIANDEVERRLIENPEEMSNRDLVVAGGVSMDKVFKAEGPAKADEDYGGALIELAADLARLGGGKVTVELSVHRPEPDEIDAEVIGEGEEPE